MEAKRCDQVGLLGWGHTSRPTLGLLGPTNIRHRVLLDPLSLAARCLKHGPHQVHIPGNRSRFDLFKSSIPPGDDVRAINCGNTPIHEW
ncbi:hypothetical protein D3C71_2024890 [compost metagenome]